MVRIFRAQGQVMMEQELTLEEAANCILSIAQAMLLAAEMAGEQPPTIELPDNVVPLKRGAACRS